jgi:hypothetical protein
VNTVGPNWLLKGESDDAANGLHWEWSLTPVF